MIHITLVSKNQYGDLLSNNSVRKALTYIIDTQGRMPYTDMSIKTYVYMGNTNKDDMLEKNLYDKKRNVPFRHAKIRPYLTTVHIQKGNMGTLSKLKQPFS